MQQKNQEIPAIISNTTNCIDTSINNINKSSIFPLNLNHIEIEKEIFPDYFHTDNEEYDPGNPNDYQKVSIFINGVNYYYYILDHRRNQEKKARRKN